MALNRANKVLLMYQRNINEKSIPKCCCVHTGCIFSQPTAETGLIDSQYQDLPKPPPPFSADIKFNVFIIRIKWAPCWLGLWVCAAFILKATENI